MSELGEILLDVQSVSEVYDSAGGEVYVVTWPVVISMHLLRRINEYS